MAVLTSDVDKRYDGYIIPLCSNEISNELIDNEAYEQVMRLLNLPDAGIGEQPHAFDMLIGNSITKIVLFRVKETGTQRERFMQMASAMKLFRNGKAESISVLAGNAEMAYKDASMLQKLFELPRLVFYSFDAYLSQKAPKAPEVSFALTQAQKDIAACVQEAAEIVAEGTLLARELVNRPAAYMTPEKLAECAVQAGQEAGFETEVWDRDQIEKVGLKSFLAVSAGAFNEPRFIIMRYNGAGDQAPKIAIVGKGITFDSGGYSLKNREGMVTMHTDMGGAAAVIGTMCVAARRKLKVNLIGLVPACENLIGPHATLPGGVISSLLGRTIEIVSTDGEGRLILCDALTYAAQNEQADILIDIATLTGSAAMAVGKRSSVVITEDEDLYATCAAASKASCEKTWRLDMDEELRSDLKSFYADTKNSPGGKKLGGTIIAALFLKPFTLGKRWMHIDMAPVAWTTSDELPYAPKGATGYGVALLSEVLYRLSEG